MLKLSASKWNSFFKVLSTCSNHIFVIEDAETAIERKEIWFSLHCLPVDLLAFLINKYSLILESKIHTSEETFEGPYNCPSASLTLGACGLWLMWVSPEPSSMAPGLLAEVPRALTGRLGARLQLLCFWAVISPSAPSRRNGTVIIKFLSTSIECLLREVVVRRAACPAPQAVSQSP